MCLQWFLNFDCKQYLRKTKISWKHFATFQRFDLFSTSINKHYPKTRQISSNSWHFVSIKHLLWVHICIFLGPSYLDSKTCCVLCKVIKFYSKITENIKMKMTQSMHFHKWIHIHNFFWPCVLVFWIQNLFGRPVFQCYYAEEY